MSRAGASNLAAVLVLVAGAGCYERNVVCIGGSCGGLSGGDAGASSDWSDPQTEWRERFVDADNQVVGHTCVPGHPEDEDWYGCEGDDPCFGPLARLRARQDGGWIVQLSPQCAGDQTMWDARLDDEQVAPNLLIWTADVSFPPGVLVPGTSVQLDRTDESWATVRWSEDIRLEEAECGHPIVETSNSEGDRWILCRHDWRSFTFEPGERMAPSAVEVTEFDPAPGGRVALGIEFAGCAEGVRPIDEPAEDDIHTIAMEPAICCAPFAAELAASVDDGGLLVPDFDEQRPYIHTRCCGPVEEESCGNRVIDVDIEDLAFRPSLVEIGEGTTVRWTNHDAVEHSVTEGTPEAATPLWDSGLIAPGETFERTFSRPGEWTYFCRTHPNVMHGAVVRVR